MKLRGAATSAATTGTTRGGGALKTREWKRGSGKRGVAAFIRAG